MNRWLGCAMNQVLITIAMNTILKDLISVFGALNFLLLIKNLLCNLELKGNRISSDLRPREYQKLLQTRISRELEEKEICLA